MRRKCNPIFEEVNAILQQSVFTRVQHKPLLVTNLQYLNKYYMKTNIPLAQVATPQEHNSLLSLLCFYSIRLSPDTCIARHSTSTPCMIWPINSKVLPHAYSSFPASFHDEITSSKQDTGKCRRVSIFVIHPPPSKILGLIVTHHRL